MSVLKGPHISRAPWPVLLRNHGVACCDAPFPRDAGLDAVAIAITAACGVVVATAWVAPAAVVMVLSVGTVSAFGRLIAVRDDIRAWARARRNGRALRRLVVQYDVWRFFHRAARVSVDLRTGVAVAENRDRVLRVDVDGIAQSVQAVYGPGDPYLLHVWAFNR